MNLASSPRTAPCDLALPASYLDRKAREALFARLAGFRDGHLVIDDGDTRSAFGDLNAPRVILTVTNPRFYREAALGGSLGVAESFLDGDWRCDDLTTLFRLLLRNLDVTDGMEGGLSRLAVAAARRLHQIHKNSISGSRRNIHAHYDLGNDFFRLFLDDTMSYSSGIFESPSATMREASIAKIDRLCRKLQLRPGDHLLEIGTGWGAFAIHAASRYGCRVTTTTISAQQRDWAREKIHEAGLEDRITLLFEDYRSLKGRYDKLVSVEMIEAVGREYLGAYFKACAELLVRGGRFALQAILMAEHRYEQYCRQVDFIQRFIFPGAHLPSRSAIERESGRWFRIADHEDITPHYAETLRRWRRDFWANVDAVRSLGYPERFVRMWDYYFCYCEAGFEERNCLNAQIVLERV